MEYVDFADAEKLVVHQEDQNDTTFIPLTEVIFHVDYVRADYSVPLKHMEIGGNSVLVGESIILGHPTKLVLHEMPSQLKVMFEQEGKRPTDPDK